MPFFIATSYRNLVQPAVDSVFAGDDILAICDNSSTLTATVVGDLAGRTILWEQISGSPVSFSTPTNQLTASFTAFNFDDKVFRFTVDKNLSSEKFDEITVFGTPTEKVAHPIQQSSASFIKHPTPVASIIVALESTPQTVVYCKDLSNPVLIWTMPDTTVQVLDFDIQFKLNSGPWTTEATTSPSSRMYTPLFADPAYKYRVVANLKTTNAVFGSPSNRQIRDIIQEDLLVVNDHIQVSIRQQAPRTMLTFSTDTLKLVNRAPDVDDVVLNQGQIPLVSIMSAFTVETLALIIKPPTESATYVTSHQKITTSQIVSFTVEDLTGGSVGG
jgi:hypothetical protein